MIPILVLIVIALALIVVVVTLNFLRKQKERLKQQQADPAPDAIPQPTAQESFKNFISFFIPKNNYFITPVIVDLNIAVFLIMVLLSGANIIDPDNAILLSWGANFRFDVVAGEWWRLFTNIFLHAGIIHLLLNMYALVYIGVLLEPILGRLKLSVAYIMTGIIASLCSAYWNPLTLSVGASGAIFGLYGVFLALLTTNCIEKELRKAILPSITVFVIYNLGYGFVKGGIDNAAHIGGLVSGLAIGYLYYPALKPTVDTNRNYITGALVVVFFVGVSASIYQNIPHDINKYEDIMYNFGKSEGVALSYFKIPETASKSEKLNALKNKSIPNWNVCLKDIQEAQRLNLPPNLQTKNRELKAYCQLRIQTFGLKYKQINEDDSTRYQNMIENYNLKITMLLDSIKNKE